MVDALILRQFFSIENAAWVAVGFLALFVLRMWNGSPAMFQQWIEWRKLKAAEKTADFDRLRAEIDRLSKSDRECRENYTLLHRRFLDNEELYQTEVADLRRELSELRGYMDGQGAARQEAAGIVAMERLGGQRDIEGKAGGK